MRAAELPCTQQPVQQAGRHVDLVAAAAAGDLQHCRVHCRWLAGPHRPALLAYELPATQAWYQEAPGVTRRRQP